MRKAAPDKIPDQLDWDEANIGHVRHGGITPEQVEQAVRNPHRVFLAGGDDEEIRLMMSGETNGGRRIIVIFEWPLYDRWGQEFLDWARPITAYDDPRSTR
ncbi:hypothetical protein [Actinomadura fibrosa]|uniref:BrnT family toxin n=1 Tax=Actinomadura fibrosa TaxID=111802 RepID=A0ABW2Y1U9_9ACTN|nr:hypothetical protein [Actinomadura fibrosa]